VVKGDYTYTATGLLASVTDAANNEITYGYDWVGRRTHSEDSDAGATNYEYDDYGNQVIANDAAVGRVKTTFDNLNRPTEVIEQQQNGRVAGSGWSRTVPSVSRRQPGMWQRIRLRGQVDRERHDRGHPVLQPRLQRRRLP
jgi:YD repeat-containing protein